MLNSLFILLLLINLSDTLLPQVVLKTVTFANNIAEEDLFGNWETEYFETKAGLITNPKSGRKITNNIAHTINLSFSDNQFSIKHRTLKEGKSSIENIQGVYTVNDNLIEFYSDDKIFAKVGWAVVKDKLFLMNIENDTSDLKLAGEYRKIVNQKGCGCGH